MVAVRRLGLICLFVAVAGYADALMAQTGEWREAGSGSRHTHTARNQQPVPQPQPPVPDPAGDSASHDDSGSNEGTLITESSPLMAADGEWVGDVPWDPCQVGLPCWGNMYADFNMLFWWRSGQSVPALVTTSPAGTAQANAGVLGLSTTSILLGGSELNDDNRIGGRVRVGKWFDPYQVNGIVASFYTLGDDNVHYSFSASDYTILGRPFFNVSTSAQDARLVTFPGISTGTINVDTHSDIAVGDVYVRMMLARGSSWRLDAIGGYQIARIDESLRVRDQLTSLDPGGSVPVNTVITTDDNFSTRNEYNAGVVGALWEYDRGSVALSFLAKVGLGNMRQQVAIAGSTTTAVPGGPTSTVASGLLTQPSNIGTFVQNEFSAVPEFDIQARWYLNECWSMTVGYTFVYWSRVARPGDHIDTTLNLTQVPGPIVGDARPRFSANSSDLFLHGLHVGLRAEW